MVWVKLDDRFAESPKILSVSVPARWLHVEAMCFAGRNETGGFVAAGFSDLRPSCLVEELVDAGLWEPAPNGWQIHDWGEFNPGAGELEAKRKRDRLRKVSARNPHGIQADPPGARVPTPTPTPTPEPGPEPEPGERASRKRAARTPSHEAVTVAEYLRDAILTHSPDHLCQSNGAAEKWAADIDKAIRLDKRTPKALRGAIDWVHRTTEGDFWAPNIQSGATLRKQFDRLQAQAGRGQGSITDGIQRWLEEGSA